MRENNKGITLIALVITIIVMLILAGVTISMAVNGGLFDYAGKAVGETKNALNEEQQLINDMIDQYIKPNLPEEIETISKTESYVGCYADVDGDGTVDGVIYADLAKGGSGNWNGYSSCSYSYEAVAAEDLKDYYVSGTADGNFGNGVDVITATGEGNDRFYVMALSDFNEADELYCWYDGCYDAEVYDIDSVTSVEFGSGKANTAEMLEIWDSSMPADEESSYECIWGHIGELASEGWFVPSEVEWFAFLGEFAVTKDNYSENYGLRASYWSSSVYYEPYALYIAITSYETDGYDFIEGDYIRLSATF